MKIVTGIIAALCMMSSTVSAQWLKYPTAGVPRRSDGKPDLSAPAPRTSEGKPDLSGIWEIEHNRPCPPGGCADMEVGQEFVDIGWSLRGGRSFTNGLPYQPWAAELRRARMNANGKDDPSSHCLPRGVVKSHTSPLLTKIVPPASRLNTIVSLPASPVALS